MTSDAYGGEGPVVPTGAGRAGAAGCEAAPRRAFDLVEHGALWRARAERGRGEG